MINYNYVREGKTCAIWTRVSTKHQEENGGSLESQKEFCDDYASRYGYRIAGRFGGKHESARTPGKMVQEMVKFVKKNTSVSTVLVSEYDRFSRLSWQAIKMLHEMRELGIVVIATKYGMDTRTKEGMMMAQNTLNFAELDNQMRTDKFVSGKEQCLRSGAWVLQVPRGYYKEGKSRSTYCRLNNDGKLIAKAFRWKLDGLAGTEIIARLRPFGMYLTQQRLHQILTNPFYAGKIRHKATCGEVIDGQIEPAVSYKDFLRVQEILSGRTGRYVQAKQKPDLPLTRYLYCAADGNAFTSYTKHKKTSMGLKDYHYYKCNHSGCGTNENAERMHERFELILSRFNLEERMLERFRDVARSLLEEYTKEAVQQRTTLKKQLTELENNQRKMAVRRALGEIQQDVYEIGVQELQSRKDVLTLEYEKWNEKLSNSEGFISKVIATASNIRDLWKEGSLETKRKIQKLVFPDGINWDKEISDYRTENRNPFFGLIERFSETCIKTKEASPRELVSLCGR